MAKMAPPLFGSPSPAPTLNAVVPSTGDVSGGDPIELTGRDIVSGATVTVGGNACTSVFFGDETDLVCRTPAGSFGAADVVITNPDTQTGALVGGYFYTNTPTVNSLAPATGLTPGGYPVVITGTNFYAPATALFGTVPAASLTVDSATQITAWPAPQSAGVVDVTVSTPVGQATLAASYTISVPAYP